MGKDSRLEEYRLSRVDIESVLKAALLLEGIDPSSEEGMKRIARDLRGNGRYIRLPDSGWHTAVWRWKDDGGVIYRMEDGYTAEDRKFIQKMLSIAWKYFALSSCQEIESSDEERKKDTSVVSEFVTGTSEDVHGGDSASGEVPDGESGGGKEDPQGRSGMPSACSEYPGGSSSTSADASDGSDSDSQKAQQQQGSAVASEWAGSSGSGAALEASECAAHTPVDEDAPQGRAGSCGEGTGGLPVIEIIDRPREWSTVPSTSGAEAAPGLEREKASISFKELRKKMRELSSSSIKENSSFGGVYAMLSEIGVPPREFIRRGQRIFARLISDLGQDEAGHRWDARKISIRAASLQNFKSKDRKSETGRPAIAVLPDVSGSMAKFALQVLEFAKALGELGVPGAEVIVIPHSNGHPLELWVNNKRTNVPVGLVGKDVQEWYRNVFVRYHVEVVVLAADWDGEWLYKWMAEALPVRIFWCDVWSCSRLAPTVVEFPPKWAGNVEWGRTDVKKVKYAFGCGSVVDFITALEKMVKTRGR
jgi:hypothetical protein